MFESSCGGKNGGVGSVKKKNNIVKIHYLQMKKLKPYCLLHFLKKYSTWVSLGPNFFEPEK